MFKNRENKTFRRNVSRLFADRKIPSAGNLISTDAVRKVRSRSTTEHCGSKNGPVHVNSECTSLFTLEKYLKMPDMKILKKLIWLKLADKDTVFI